MKRSERMFLGDSKEPGRVKNRKKRSAYTYGIAIYKQIISYILRKHAEEDLFVLS